jgi:hypothetical protein
MNLKSKKIGINIIILANRRLNYTGIMSTGFKDFLLRPELQRAVIDCGFEHPSEGIDSEC